MKNNIVANFEKAQMDQIVPNIDYDNFTVGDQVVVKTKIGERFQNYEGVCIAKKNRGFNSSFTVFKRSYGVAVERVFPYYSPNIESVKVKKRGKVRRAKLYYLTQLVGKAARIAEATTGYKSKL